MITSKKISNYLSIDRIKASLSSGVKQYRLFTLPPAAKVFSPDVVPSPAFHELYRLDRLDFTCDSEMSGPFRFNLLELLFFRIAGIQGQITAKDVVDHQGSTRLVGTTADKKVVLKLSQSWTDRNAVLIIDPRLVQDRLIDVENTTKRAGTAFFTKFQELEQALTLLPIFIVKEMQRLPGDHILTNPLYIQPTPEIMTELQMILSSQMAFLKQVYEDGKDMSSGERQLALNAVLKETAEFFQEQLKEKNPFSMTLTQFDQQYGITSSDKKIIGRHHSAASVLDVLKADGDDLFQSSERYKHLLGYGRLKEVIERANEENGYGSRTSYTHE